MSALPHDPDAEEAVVGVCLLSEDACRWVSEWLRPEDFMTPKWSAAVAAIQGLHRQGRRADAVVVAEAAAYPGLTVVDLTTAYANAGSPGQVAQYGQIVRKHAVARVAMSLCRAALSSLSERKGDPDELVEALREDLRGIDSHVSGGYPAGFATFEDIRARPPEERAAPWVLQGLLRRDWRAVFVGPEGAGKTLLLRQIAVSAAMGMPPFGQLQMVAEPVRSLLVDLENPAGHVADWVDRLCRHGERLRRQTEGRGAVWHQPGGIDLRKRVWRSQFEDVLRLHRPDLVCLGPLYKAFRRKSTETEEEAAGEMQEILDDLRTRHGFALVMEHHAPKGSAFGSRELVPFGSSLWLRWGEIRMSLTPPDRDFPVWEMELRPYSGTREEHSWPNHIDRNRGSGLPWLGRWDSSGEEI